MTCLTPIQASATPEVQCAGQNQRGGDNFSGWASTGGKFTRPPARTAVTSSWAGGAWYKQRWIIAGWRNGECPVYRNNG
jgi:hypothetical protein